MKETNKRSRGGVAWCPSFVKAGGSLRTVVAVRPRVFRSKIVCSGSFGEEFGRVETAVRRRAPASAWIPRLVRLAEHEAFNVRSASRALMLVRLVAERHSPSERVKLFGQPLSIVVLNGRRGSDVASPRDLASFVFHLCRCTNAGIRLSGARQDLSWWLEAALRQSGQAEALDLWMCIDGARGLTVPTALTEAWFGRMMDLIAAQKLPVRQLVACFHSFASWKDPPTLSLDVSDAWTEEIIRMTDMDGLLDAQDYASTLWALGKLRVRPSNPNVVTRILESLMLQPVDMTQGNGPHYSRMYESFSPEQMSMILHGLAMLRHDERLREPKRAEILQRSISSWIEASKQQMSQFDPKSASLILYSVSLIGAQISGLHEWLHIWALEAGTRNALLFSGPGLVLVINSFARLRVEPHEAFLHRWTTAFDRNLNKMDSRGIAVALHSLAMVHRRPSPQLVRQCCTALRSRSDPISVQSLTLEISALSRFGLDPGSDFLFKWFLDTELALRRGEFQCRSLANVAFALARLRPLLPTTFCEAFLHELELHLHESTPRCLVQFFWAFGSLSELGLRPSNQLREDLHLRVLRNLPRVSPSGLITLSRTLLIFHTEEPGSDLWNRIVESCKATINYNPGDLASNRVILELHDLVRRFERLSDPSRSMR
uniref:Uncharacterized protein n=1 Tax=Compsopogon caeruleus TaxID=31354 RepID=A0A7S1XEF4_9RHOD|mmetsp:Transcript_3392/g.6362  ORF Transcript_3392/g.6362 Transcript_3392/m.6362 type:complete len:658 (+) Transcript_3392:75-2048(+)